MSRGKTLVRQVLGTKPDAIPDPIKGRTKCAIVGFTPTRIQAPFTDPAFECWGMNMLYMHKDVGQCHRWFDLHPFEDIDTNRVGWYSRCGIPVMMHHQHPEIPTSMRFPKPELVEYFGREYFTSSPAWMLALAIAMGFNEIHIYGIDMSTDSEFYTQRPCIEHWLGVAEGFGIKTFVPDGGDLMKASHSYGYGSDGGLRARLKAKQAAVAQDIHNVNEQMKQLAFRMEFLKGVKADCEFWIRNWGVADKSSMDRKDNPHDPINQPPQVGHLPAMRIQTDGQNGPEIVVPEPVEVG